MKRVLFLMLLLVPLSAAALTPLEAGIMEARVLTTNTVTFQSESARYRVDEATARLTWFPRDDALQDVTSLETTPDAELLPEEIVFSWRRPGRSEDLSVAAVVQTRNSIVPVRAKIPFPITQLPPDAERYLGTGEIIDTSPRIQRLAQELASGKDDLYDVVFTLADWTTTNVEYSLASLGQPAIQTATEVLKSREGKCDEMTALFISLNRALGIPARFVAGYSYTNSDILQREWGGHGWAEVWFPDVGWVPFDVTYGEYGYLDAGHIRLKTSDDAKETSIDFSARGTAFSLQTEPLDIYVTPIDMVANYEERITMKLDSPYRTVGFGSAVLILATITNNRDFYVATRLDLAQTSNTRMLSDTYRNVLLKPRQTKVVPFLVQIDRGLDDGFRYEFPFKLSTRLGQDATIAIDVEPGSPVYAKDEFEDIIEKYTAAQVRAARFSVTCSRGAAYAGQPVVHECEAQGASGESLLVCKGSTCKEKPLPTFTLETRIDEPGMHTDVYTARQGSDQSTFFVTSRSVAPTQLSIKIDHPPSMTPDGEIGVEVYVDHTGAMPMNVSVTLSAVYGSATERIADLNAPARVQFALSPSTIRPGENELAVEIAYVDELGTQGTATATSALALTDVGPVDRVLYALRAFGHWMDGLFT